MGGGRRQHEVTRRESRRGPIVEYDAVFAQHDAVSRLADGQARDDIGVHPVEEDAGFRALHVDLAQRRDVADTNAAAHAANLADQRAFPVRLASDRKGFRAPPFAQIDERRTAALRPAMARRETAGPELQAAVGSRERADRNRRVRRPRSDGSEVRGRPPRRGSNQRVPVDSRRLALVRTHAQGRVALEQLGGVKAFARGDGNILGRHVMLGVDECLAAKAGHEPERRRAERLVSDPRQRLRRRRRSPQRSPPPGRLRLPRATRSPVRNPRPPRQQRSSRAASRRAHAR